MSLYKNILQQWMASVIGRLEICNDHVRNRFVRTIYCAIRNSESHCISAHLSASFKIMQDMNGFRRAADKIKCVARILHSEFHRM